MEKGMSDIYLTDREDGFIEVEQQNTRNAVIEQYIRVRKNQGLTQAELAKRAGIPRTNITRFESCNYNPSLEMMVKIASALNMKVQIQLVGK